ncbi:peroxisomal leader peptide-processing protease [Sitodiplosis mosellana]|uniref:peroxisomal leader peptide-processing protease n=1 Tax=Sitodiplosis mosellana TaxID=263140 RepID=UPI0024439F7C|nr:peroxisomal leader peptide-processing protease [Sitodiplosis mosellana]
MNQNLHHGIIYGESDPLFRKSCVIFSDQYCLAPASLLLNSFENIRNEVNTSADFDILKDLKFNRIIDSNASQRYHCLAKYNYKIVYEHNDVLYKSDATISKIFKCRNIWNSFNDILRNFVARTSANNESNNLHKLLLSSFIIFKMRVKDEANLGDNSSSLVIFNDITKSVFKKGPQHHCEKLPMNVIRKLENIESISTPFGNECFLNTINVGRIANIFGDNKCLMVASMPLVNGCEGGAVYNKDKDLIGIVVSTTFDWNSENATLTLVAKFNEIMAEFVEQSKLTSINIENEYNSCNNVKYINNTKVNCKASNCVSKDSYKFENFIVLIQSADSWGSGCFVQINEVRMIITCAHVLENHDGNVRCTWKFGHFESKIIFKNPHFDQAFDIAILEAPPNVPELYFTKCYTIPTKIGQTVYSSGFPHFTSLGKVHDFFPSIFEGRITKISKGVIFSDASVQSGQSGGPMFTDDGHLIGITVSNSKDDAYQLIYPNINMSVPVYEIFPILQQYGKSKDERHLQNLVANKEVKSVWALETPKILCKL